MALTPGGAADSTLEIQISLDTSQAKQNLQQVGQQAQQAGEQAGHGFSMGMGRIAVGVAAVSAAMMAALERASQLAESVARARWLGVAAEDAARLNESLGDTLTKAESLAALSRLRLLGFDQAEAQTLAKTAEAISAITGDTQQIVLAAIQAGQLSEAQLRAVGKTQEGLALALTEARVATKGLELNTVETTRAAMRYLAVTDDIAAKAKEIRADNPWQETKKQIKEAGDIVAEFVGDKVQGHIIRGWRNVADEIRLIFGRAPMQIALAGQAAINATEAIARRVLGDQGFADFRAQFMAQQQAAAKAAAAARKTAEERDQAARLAAKKRKEELDELLSGKGKDETGIDEFGRAALSAAVAVRSVGGALLESEDRANALAQQMDLAAAGGQRAAHQQAIYAAAMEKGKIAASALAKEEEKRTAALRASLAVSEADKAAITTAAEIATRREQITGRDLATARAIKALKESDNDLADKMIPRLQAAADLYRRQVNEQIKLLETAQRLAAITERERMLIEDLAGQQQILQVREQIRQSAAATAQIQGREVLDRGEALRAQAEQLRLSIDQLTIERSLLEMRRNMATSERDRAILDQRIAQNAALEQVQWRQVAALQAQAAATNAAASAQLNLGATIQKMAADTQQPSKQIAAQAQQILSTTTTFAQSMGTAIGTLFEQMITTPEQALGAFGKAILSAFGDIALQTAAFFAAQGVALLWTIGGAPQGVGLLAAAAALAAVGGTLKGVGGLIGNTAQKPSGTPTGGGTSSPTQQGIPGQRTPQDQRPVQIFVSVNEEPWNRKSEADRWRDFTRWAGQGARQTGVKI